ncbi:hypothetical protein [uncultured Cardiobacterium sp.]|uniref:hypothetical protein n=1 Tax=uncultured Cardiobacterium sp. TaxID=417619 RepID=UPI00262DF6CA|nr:hypothetical protein [uncultured Cardiobacterium sp.]
MRHLTLLTLALAAPAFAADSAEAPAALNEALVTPAAETDKPTGESSPAIEAAKRAAEAAAAKPANETAPTAEAAEPGVLAATPATLPPAATKPLTKDALVGAWTCSTSYPALSARLDEHYEFRVDGSAESDGMMTFFLKAGLLHYDVHNKDRWSLADNTLTIDISDYTVIRALKPRMAEILAKSPELTAYEEKLFASLNHGSKNGRIRLTITSHDAQSLQMHDESGNLSECSRPQ